MNKYLFVFVFILSIFTSYSENILYLKNDNLNHVIVKLCEKKDLMFPKLKTDISFQCMYLSKITNINLQLRHVYTKLPFPTDFYGINVIQVSYENNLLEIVIANNEFYRIFYFANNNPIYRDICCAYNKMISDSINNEKNRKNKTLYDNILKNTLGNDENFANQEFIDDISIDEYISKKLQCECSRQGENLKFSFFFTEKANEFYNDQITMFKLCAIFDLKSAISKLNDLPNKYVYKLCYNFYTGKIAQNSYIIKFMNYCIQTIKNVDYEFAYQMQSILSTELNSVFDINPVFYQMTDDYIEKHANNFFMYFEAIANIVRECEQNFELCLLRYNFVNKLSQYYNKNFEKMMYVLIYTCYMYACIFSKIYDFRNDEIEQFDKVFCELRNYYEKYCINSANTFDNKQNYNEQPYVKIHS